MSSDNNRQSLLNLDLQESTLNKYLVNIYKNLFKQQGSISKLATIAKSKVSNNQITEVLDQMVHSCQVNSSQLNYKANLKMEMEKGFRAELPGKEEYTSSLKTFSTKLFMFSKMFDVVEDKFEEINQRINFM